MRLNKARKLLGEYPKDNMADAMMHEACHQTLEDHGQTRKPTAAKLAGIDTRHPDLSNKPLIAHRIRQKLPIVIR